MTTLKLQKRKECVRQTDSTYRFCLKSIFVEEIVVADFCFIFLSAKELFLTCRLKLHVNAVQVQGKWASQCVCKCVSEWVIVVMSMRVCFNFFLLLSLFCCDNFSFLYAKRFKFSVSAVSVCLQNVVSSCSCCCYLCCCCCCCQRYNKKCFVWISIFFLFSLPLPVFLKLFVYHMGLWRSVDLSVCLSVCLYVCRLNGKMLFGVVFFLFLFSIYDLYLMLLFLSEFLLLLLLLVLLLLLLSP